MKKRFILLVLCLLSLTFIPVFAQGSCSQSMSREDCSILTTALDDLTALRRARISVTMSFVIEQGNLNTTTLELVGEGLVVLDDAGQIEEMDIRFPENALTIDSMMFGGTYAGALGIILKDDVLYLAQGSNIEHLEWKKLDLSDYKDDIQWSFSSIFPSRYLSQFPGGDVWQSAEDMALETGDVLKIYQIQILDPQPIQTAFGQFGALLGSAQTNGDAGGEAMGSVMGSIFGDAYAESMGLQGAAYYGGGLYLDDTTRVVRGFNTVTSLVIDMSGMMNNASGGDPLLNMFGEMAIGTQITQNVNFAVYILETDPEIEITVPTSASILPESQIANFAASGQNGLMPLIMRYYMPEYLNASLGILSGEVPPTPTIPPYTSTPTYTPTITLTPSITPTPSATYTPSITPTPSLTFTPSATYTASATFTATNTPTKTLTPSPTYTPSITPTPSLTFTPAATATNTATPQPAGCPGNLPSRMIIGERGRVTPGDPNNLRSGSSTEFGRIDRIPAGDVFLVMDGPECNDGYTWWMVQYNGKMGWTVESGDGKYWLEPIGP